MRKINLLVIFAVLTSISFVNADVIPTNEWVNIFSANTTLDGSQIPADSMMFPYDKSGDICESMRQKLKSVWILLV
ncbi:MAG: hypothetical protein ABIJ12_13625 [bacterium]